MLERAFAAGVPARWVIADEAYGQDRKFRAWLENRRTGYVVAVPRSQTVPTVNGTARADTLARNAPLEAWKRRSAGDGAKGPRLYDWAAATLPPDPDRYSDLSWWLLIRRSTTDPDDRAFHLCFGPTGTPDDELVRVAGSRWAVEECFQTAKTEIGLDQYQVRRYDAWYRHITLAMLAHAYLAVTAANTPAGGTRTALSASPSARSDVSWHTRSLRRSTKIDSTGGPTGADATSTVRKRATTRGNEHSHQVRLEY